jgi:hypothetical protein
MRLHERCQWDARKASQNLRKHGVKFTDAAAVLLDEDGDVHHLEQFDAEHSDQEDRWITTGSMPSDRSYLMRIVWTQRVDGKHVVTRIISARFLSPLERREYYETPR